MNLWESFLYGAVQGITEYLPISSSAHLILLPRFLKTEDPGLAFDVFLHAGTLASTLWFFRSDWKNLFFDGFVALKKGVKPFMHSKLGWVVIATIPALIAGAGLRQVIATEFRANGVMVTTLVVGGLLLWGTDWVREKYFLQASRRKTSDLGIRGSLVVGLFQCLALIPGMSRSGSTMIGGRYLGLSREEAARFSFWLSAPVTFAALVFEMRHMTELMQNQLSPAVLLVGALSSFFAGWAAIGVLLKFVPRFGFFGFVVYRVLLAITIVQVLGV